jgi:fructose-specific component phosphotransferase system IIB-like protein
MMYWEYPLIMPADRLAHAEALDPEKIHVSPAEAYTRLGAGLPDPSGVRLETFNGRPVYKFGHGSDQAMVYADVNADNGARQESFPPALTRNVAASWSGLPAAAATEQQPVPVDQWTVFEGFQELQPLRKYSWPSGEQVYVSALNGEVVQSTTRTSRLGAYLGPIPHWLYFTPLRRNSARWTQLMIWSSGLAAIAALIGLTVGVWMYSPRKRFQYSGAPSALPYVGWKRWHAIFGLIFGVLACTWTFSGMLSMDPFPQWQGERGGQIRTGFSKALRSNTIPLSGFNAKPPETALHEAGDNIKEADLAVVLGEPVYLMKLNGGETRIVPVSDEPRAQFSSSEILAALEHASAPYSIASTRIVRRYESYYLDRHNRLPLPVIYAELNDPQRTAFYIDPTTAQIVEGYNSQSRRNRWLYHGLHSFNLPLLYDHRPAWDVLVLALMLGGVALSITAIVLALEVLGRKFGRRVARSPD